MLAKRRQNKEFFGAGLDSHPSWRTFC
jgi:hypothetical protein